MLIHGPTHPLAAAFWQWMNQTLNVMCNYVNRSGAAVDMTQLGQSYLLAVAFSCTIAMSFGKLLQVYPALQAMGPFVPYVSVVAASTANMGFSRWDEWQKGVNVYDASGNDLGKSPKAGFQAVFQTLWTRCWMLPVALLIIPPVTLVAMRRLFTGLMANRAAALTIEIGVILGCLQQALPLALALAPVTLELDVADLEPEFRGLVDKTTGRPVEKVFANKGL